MERTMSPKENLNWVNLIQIIMTKHDSPDSILSQFGLGLIQVLTLIQSRPDWPSTLSSFNLHNTTMGDLYIGTTVTNQLRQYYAWIQTLKHGNWHSQLLKTFPNPFVPVTA